MAQKPTQFCPQCGSQMAEGQRFCTNCGTTIGPEVNNPTVAASGPTQAAFPVNQSSTADPVKPTSATTIPDTDQPASFSGTIYNQEVTPPPPPPPPFTHYPPPPGGSGVQSYPQQGPGSMPGGVQSYPQQGSGSMPGGVQGYPQQGSGSMPGGVQGYPQQGSGSMPGGVQSYRPDTGSSPSYTPVPPAGNYQVPSYAQQPKRGHGCLITSIILLVVLALGIGGFVFIRSRSSASNSGNTANSGSNGNSTATSAPTSGTTPTTAVSSSEQLNLNITYASVAIKIVSAQTAQSFSDDDDTTGSAGVFRINLQENNPTGSNPDYLESSSMLLVLPGGNTMQPGNEEQSVSPDAGVNRPNWLDFPLTTPVTLSQLTLRIGTSSENQMNVPLQPGADISKYQDQTSSQSAQFQYAGISWTIKTATLSYSYDDQQATTGNRYALVTLAAVNSTSDDFVDSPSSYIRLQAGGNSVLPDNTTTLPTELAGNSTGSGVVAFLVPQDATSFTLVMLAQPSTSPPVPQVTQAFSIQ